MQSKLQLKVSNTTGIQLKPELFYYSSLKA